MPESFPLTDLHRIATTLSVGELQFYTEHLSQLRATGSLAFQLVHGAQDEFSCKDGPYRSISYVLEDNEAYHQWHHETLQKIKQQLAFQPERVATVDQYKHLTREQFATVAQNARQEQQGKSQPIKKKKSVPKTKERPTNASKELNETEVKGLTEVGSATSLTSQESAAV